MFSRKMVGVGCAASRLDEMGLPAMQFTNNDRPHAAVRTSYDAAAQRLAVVGTHVEWQGSADSGVLWMTRVPTFKSSLRTMTASDADVAGQDFRTKSGKKMDIQRKEYGMTSNRAAAKPAMMDAAENLAKRIDKAMAKRETLDRELDGEADVADAEVPRKQRRAGDKTTAAPQREEKEKAPRNKSAKMY
jgi:hypothetical protein